MFNAYLRAMVHQSNSLNTSMVYKYEFFAIMASVAQCSVCGFVKVSDLQAGNSCQLHQQCHQKKSSYTFPTRQCQQQLQVPYRRQKHDEWQVNTSEALAKLHQHVVCLFIHSFFHSLIHSLLYLTLDINVSIIAAKMIWIPTAHIYVFPSEHNVIAPSAGSTNK